MQRQRCGRCSGRAEASERTAAGRILINDSGSLWDDLQQYASDPRITLFLSPDGPRPQGWQINEVWRQGLVRGELVCYLSDDDVYEANAFAVWAEAANQHPEQSAWYGSVEVTEVRMDGMEQRVGELLAGLAGTAAYSLDCRADGMQVCHRRSAYVLWPEERDHAWHADGVFLDRLGKLTTIYPLPALIGRHRRTASSRFTRSSDAD